MSLFVADLAFAGPDEAARLTSAKLGILGASIVAGIVGWIVLGRGHADAPADATPDEVAPVAELR